MNSGINLAFKTFQHSAKTVPAFRLFLKKRGIRPSLKISSLKTFQTIPVSDKNNYIKRYSLFQLLPKGHILSQIFASSGSLGKPYFWFRGRTQEQMGGIIHEEIFKKIFKLQPQQPTLVIICFAMGVWVAGGFTLAACKWIAKEKKWQLCCITPGIDKSDIFLIFQNLVPKFKQVILAGYPPFIFEIMAELKQKNVRVVPNLKILTAGDKFIEPWRSNMLKILRQKTASSIINIYGSADVGLMAYETPLTIHIRKLALKVPKLYSELFDDEAVLPGLFQYHPEYIYFEELGGELLVTAPAGIPLIRYNIHDFGKILPMKRLRHILNQNKVFDLQLKKLIKQWPLPLVAVKSRRDVALTFYALNIYPESISSALEKPQIAKAATGRFFAYTTQSTTNKFQKFYINVEIKKGLAPSRQLTEVIQKSISQTLLRTNSEFRKLFATLSKRALPIVTLVSAGSVRLKPKNQQEGLIYQKGSKPKIVI